MKTQSQNSQIFTKVKGTSIKSYKASQKSQMQIFSFSETPPFQRRQQKPLDTFSAKPAVAGGIKVIRSGIQGSTLYVLWYYYWYHWSTSLYPALLCAAMVSMVIFLSI